MKPALTRYVRCPKCKRKVKPWIMGFVEAVPDVHPPIPARLQVKCAAKGCGQLFYVVDDAS
jgi:hypothetical protein